MRYPKTDNAFAGDGSTWLTAGVERHLEGNTGWYPTWRADGLGGLVGGDENDEVGLSGFC